MDKNDHDTNITSRNGAAGSGDGRDRLGRFAIGNGGRPKGSRNKASIIATKLLHGESGALARKAVELALAGDTTALRLALSHVLPPVRAQSERVHVRGLADATTPADQARAVTRAVALGQISPDAAQAILTALAAASKVIEADELEARIRALEGRNAA